jgi:hypothetical protein
MDRKIQAIAVLKPGMTLLFFLLLAVMLRGERLKKLKCDRIVTIALQYCHSSLAFAPAE